MGSNPIDFVIDGVSVRVQATVCFAEADHHNTRSGKMLMALLEQIELMIAREPGIWGAIAARKSKQARDLEAKLRAAVEAMPDLSNVLTWLQNECDPLDAVRELEIYKTRIDAFLASTEKIDG